MPEHGHTCSERVACTKQTLGKLAATGEVTACSRDQTFVELPSRNSQIISRGGIDVLLKCFHAYRPHTSTMKKNNENKACDAC